MQRMCQEQFLLILLPLGSKKEQQQQCISWKGILGTAVLCSDRVCSCWKETHPIFFFFLFCCQGPCWEDKKLLILVAKYRVISPIPPAAVNSTAALQDYNSQSGLYSMTHTAHGIAMSPLLESAHEAGNESEVAPLTEHFLTCPSHFMPLKLTDDIWHPSAPETAGLLFAFFMVLSSVIHEFPSL